MDTPLRAAIYARISSDKEGRGLNVATQVEDCRKVCSSDSRRWQVIEPPYVDNDISAADPTKERRAYQRMMADVGQGLIDVVVVAKEDRLHRQPMELEQFVAACRTAGMTKLFSVKSGLTDIGSETALLTIRIKGDVAAYEVGMIRDRVTRKKRALAEAGSYGGGQRPFGYRVVDKKLVIDDFEAVLVKEAADLVLQGASLASIRRKWNDHPIPTPRDKSWSTTVIRNMLISPLMTGLRQYGTDNDGKPVIVGEAVWDGILDRGTHERLVAKLTAPERRTPAPSRSYVLRGLLVCDHCGHPLIATPRTRNGVSARNYSCRKDVHGCCGSVFVNAEAVEAVVLGALLPLADDEGFRSALANVQEDYMTEAKALTAQIASDDATLAELADDHYQTHVIDKQTFIAQTRITKAHRDVATNRLASLRGTSALDRMGGHVRDAWPTMNADDKRMILDTLVTEVRVRKPSNRGSHVFDPSRLVLGLRYEAVIDKDWFDFGGTLAIAHADRPLLAL